jgi:hypothetical protein
MMELANWDIKLLHFYTIFRVTVSYFCRMMIDMQIMILSISILLPYPVVTYICSLAVLKWWDELLGRVILEPVYAIGNDRKIWLVHLGEACSHQNLANPLRW